MPKLGNDIKEEKKKIVKSKGVVSAYSEEGVQRKKTAKKREIISFVCMIGLLIVFLIVFTLFAFNVIHF